MNSDKILREQLLALLKGGNAHLALNKAFKDFPPEKFNTKISNVGYTPWQLLEHMRICQWDILEFIRDPEHVSPDWPDGYWPEPGKTANEIMWRNTLDQFFADLESIIEFVNDPKSDLYADLPHASGYNLLREILLVADHNSYHMGQFLLMKKSLR